MATSPQEFIDSIKATVAETVAKTASTCFSTFQQQRQQQEAQYQSKVRSPQYQEVLVNRTDDHGNIITVRTSVPQLLAELNDHMLDLLDVVSDDGRSRGPRSRERRRRK